MSRAGLSRETVVLFLLVMLSLALPRESLAGTVSEGDVRKALVDYLEDQAPPGTELTQWELGRGDSLPPKGEILAVEKAPGSTWRTDMRMRVLIGNSAREAQAYWVTAGLSYSRKVLVACRNLPIGHLISRGDVRAEFREGWKTDRNVLARLEDVEGRSIRRPVSKGSFIKKWHVKESGTMRNGDAVDIIARKGGLTVKAPGLVMEAGAPGDTVRVLNTATGKEIYARVVDPKTVAVSF